MDDIKYPFPLRNNQLVYLYLPADLTVEEAKRLYDFMNALVDKSVPVKSIPVEDEK